jgi:uncharacterized membrane protein YeaQ/YmgE (transglycosylase-associated protein family)
MLKMTFYRRNSRGKPVRSEQQYIEGGEGREINWTAKDKDMDESLIAVWERWDKTTNTVYTFADGGDLFLKEPSVPMPMTERFYPYFIRGDNWTEDDEWPLSDAADLQGLQDEYTNTRHQQKTHRELNKPHWIGNKSLIADRKDIKAFADAVIGAIVLIDAGNRSVEDVFKPATMLPYNPAQYDTSYIVTDIDRQSGLGDAQRGAVVRAKTATEASQLQSGLSDRVGERQNDSEDYLAEMAEAALQMLLQMITPDEIMQKYGGSAVWPSLESRRELYNMVDVRIKAGSTSKPDREKDMRQWTMVMPEIRATLQEALRMQMTLGIPWEQQTSVKLLRETLRRFDESIDIAELMGPEFNQIQGMAMGMAPTMGGLNNVINGAVGAVGGTGSPTNQPGQAPVNPGGPEASMETNVGAPEQLQ